MFYSQGMRASMLHAMMEWEDDEMHHTIKDIILRKFYQQNEFNLNAHIFKMIDPQYYIKMLVPSLGTQFRSNGMKHVMTFMKMFKIKNVLYIDDVNGQFHHSRMHALSDTGFSKSKYNNILDALPLYGSINPDVIMIFKYTKNSSTGFYNERSKVSMKNGLDAYMYNDKKYIIDTIYLHNHNGEVTKKHHAVAGITIDNKKYLYNGWTKITNDPSMSSQMKNFEPCPLEQYDWLENADFEIRYDDCGFVKGMRNGEMTFNPYKGNIIYFAVREDLYNLGKVYNQKVIDNMTQVSGKICMADDNVAFNPVRERNACENISLSAYRGKTNKDIFTVNPVYECNCQVCHNNPVFDDDTSVQGSKTKKRI
jgi:hypothetical protein